MRWSILRTLLHKEALRHLANRGGIALLLLLVVAALLLSSFGGNGAGAGGLAPGVRLCYVDYWEEDALVAHLRRHVPADLADHLRFRPANAANTNGAGTLVYSQGTGAIQLRPGAGPEGAYLVWFWHPGSDAGGLAVYEAWFWREALRFEKSRKGTARLPVITAQWSGLGGGLDPRSGMATALVLFGLFFVCVYLLPSLTCEERERGVLLAQALSPATPREILAAKFLFYPTLGLVLAALLTATCRPQALARPFFWLAVVIAAAGAMGVGLTIASLARTQRSASTGALCYTLTVALLLFICQHNQIPALPYLALEYHGPRMLHAALTGTVQVAHWGNLAAAAVIAAVWTTLAAFLSRRYGWQ